MIRIISLIIFTKFYLKFWVDNPNKLILNLIILINKNSLLILMGCVTTKKTKSDREVDYFVGMEENEKNNSEKKRNFLIQRNPIFLRRASSKKEDNQSSRLTSSYITRNKWINYSTSNLLILFFSVISIY